MTGIHITDNVQADSIANKAGTGAPAFPYGLTDRGKANLPAQATAWTLTADSPMDLHIASPASAINQDLPTTNVKAGKRFRLFVSGATEANYVALRSSGGNAIDRIGGSGFIEVEALQDAPTTAAHWRVLLLDEWTGTLSGTTTGAATVAFSLIAHRQYSISAANTIFTGFAASAVGSASAAASITIPANTLPSRFWPAAYRYFACMTSSGGGGMAGMGQVMTDGSIIFYKYDASNYTSNAGITSGATYFTSFNWLP